APAARVTGGDAVAGRAEDPGRLPPDRTRQRVATAPAVVRTECDGRFARRGLRAGAQGHSVSVPRQVVGAQRGAVQLSATTLDEPVRSRLRGPALRFDQYLLRMRSAGGRQAALRLQPG